MFFSSCEPFRSMRALLGDAEGVDPIGVSDDKHPEPEIEPTIRRLKKLHKL